MVSGLYSEYTETEADVEIEIEICCDTLSSYPGFGEDYMIVDEWYSMHAWIFFTFRLEDHELGEGI